MRVVRFRPPKPYAVRRLNNRTHRKICVADGRVGLTGGVGIADEWTGDAQDADHWRDTHVRVAGRSCAGSSAPSRRTGSRRPARCWSATPTCPSSRSEDGGGPMQLVRSSAGVGDTNMEALYYLAIAAAERSLDLTAAYFAPRPRSPRRSAGAPQRGVRVRVLVPGERTDKPSVRPAGRASYDELLDGRRRGVRVPADDAARQVARARRHLVVGRLGQLRQPLVPAQRRGDAVRAVARRSRRS